jgi:hypothetical protein
MVIKYIPYSIVLFRSSYKEVHVSLADLNDHPPVFDKEEYEIRVPESALVNTPLTRLKVRASSLVIISVAIFTPKGIFPSRVLDPGVEMIPDPGSGSATKYI